MAAGCTDAGSADPPTINFECSDGDAQLNLGEAGCLFAVATPASWGDARVDCQASGAELIQIDSAEKNQRVFDLAGEVLDPELPDFWLLGNDIITEGNWVWGGETTPFEFDVWRMGEPNNGAGIEDCMVFEADNPAQEWDDRSCIRLQPYLCERDAIPVME